MKKSIMRFFDIWLITALISITVLAAPSAIESVETSDETAFEYIPELIAHSFSQVEYVNADQISFVLSDNGTLTVSGNGKVSALPPEIDELLVKKLVLENGITAVGEYAFYGCENLSQISATDSLSYIGEKAFDATAFLANKSNGAVYVGNVLYTYKGEIQNDGAFALKNGTTGIAYGALFARTEITEITIPDTVKAIGERAFYGCTSLENITFGTGLSYVGSDAFYDTPWLEEQNGLVVIGKTLYEYKGNDAFVEIASTVEYISSNAFARNTGVLEIVISDSVKYIFENAFTAVKILKA